MQAAVVVFLAFLLTGCVFNLREKEDFKSWYYGDPGLAGALGEADCDRYADNIEGRRHPYFLHFRTPEVLLQPQGGAHYPARQTAESRAGGFRSNRPRCEKVAMGWETFRFDAVDAGWVDTLIPYRKASTLNDGDRGMGERSLAYAEGLVYNTGLAAVMKAPVYIVHDILKTLYIPVAGTYYLFKPDEPPPAIDIIQVKSEAPADDIPAASDGSSATATDDVDAVHAPSKEERSVALAQAEPGEEPPKTPGEQGAGSASSLDNEEAADPPDDPPDEPLADTDTAAQAAGADADRAVAGPPSAEGDAEPVPMADASSEEPAPETEADEPQVSAPDGPTPVAAGELPAIPPVADEERAIDDKPRAVPGSAQPPPASEVRAMEQDEPPAPVEAVSEDAVPDEAVARSAQTAPDASPHTDPELEADPPSIAKALPAGDPAVTGTREADTMPGETATAEPDPAPLTADEAVSSDALPPAGDNVPETPAPSSGELPAPAPQVANEGPAERSAVDTDMSAETASGAREIRDATAGQAQSTASGHVGDAAETGAPTAPLEDASPPAERPLESQAEEDRVSAAVTSLTEVARGAAAATDDGAPTPSASGAQGGEIQEEDLPSGPTEEDAAPTGAANEDADAPPMIEEKPLRGAGAPPDPVASMTADQHTGPPQEASPIDRVRVSPKALQKKVAFIGFFSRAVNIDAETKDGLEAYLWPALEDECRDDLTILRRGDTGYPSALDSLVRDPFGRMNSFELVTLARFSGLNAVVAGTIIDIRVANALSGILWYKSPQGQLRVTILVEVFDAETGTKLFDRTYIREEEVNELEPDADGRLRPEDLPILEATLKSVALEMGEDVCDALEDQPWRAFVSGIDGSRVTLSAGRGVGLKPGNIFGVYNSQIIDGLNNQQFFLTGEKVGRIQILHVYPDRSEAILIEGRDLRDYSVVMPE